MCDVGPCESSPFIYRPHVPLPQAVGVEVDCFADARDKCVLLSNVPSSSPQPTCTTVRSAIINEFEPNPMGRNPKTANFEIRGPPGEMFFGEVVSIDSDNYIKHKVGMVNEVGGRFDDYGILRIVVTGFENPSHTVVLTEGFLAFPGYNLDADGDGIIDSPLMLGSVLDAIGIPNSMADQSVVLGKQIGGIDMNYIGSKAKLVFRDGCTLAWYAVSSPENDRQVFDQNANVLNNQSEFNVDPREQTFGFANPTRIYMA